MFWRHTLHFSLEYSLEETITNTLRKYSSSCVCTNVFYFHPDNLPRSTQPAEETTSQGVVIFSARSMSITFPNTCPICPTETGRWDSVLNWYNRDRMWPAKVDLVVCINKKAWRDNTKCKCNRVRASNGEPGWYRVLELYKKGKRLN